MDLVRAADDALRAYTVADEAVVASYNGMWMANATPGERRAARNALKTKLEAAEQKMNAAQQARDDAPEDE